MTDANGKLQILFEVPTPLGFSVRCTRRYWNFIVTEKHPSLKHKLKQVIQTLQHPEESRRSKSDPGVFLFYSGHQKKWLCAVSKNDQGMGFLITAYLTEAIKSGERVWVKSK